MMLDWLGETDMAERVERAVAAVIAEGQVRTYDMGGSNSTLEMAEAIAMRIPKDGDGGGMTSGILRRGRRTGGLVRQSQGVSA